MSSSSQWPLIQFKDSGETSPKTQPSHQQVSTSPHPARAHSQLHWNLAQPTSGPTTAPRSPGHATSHHGRHSLGINQIRKSPTYQSSHSSQFYHNRRVHAAHMVGTLRAYSSGVCCCLIGHLLHKATSARLGTVTNLPNRNKQHRELGEIRSQRNMFQMKEQDKNLRKRTEQSGGKQSA